jgi:putative ABC transport system permease protein
MGALLQDLRYAFRTLRKSPGFVLIAVLSLTLGIGLNTAAFSLVQAVFLRSWPARDPGSLVKLNAQAPRGIIEAEFSYLEWNDISSQISDFSGVMAYSRHGRFIGPPSDARFIAVDIVSRNYFSVLGLNPAAGRFMSSDEPPDTVVLSYSVWQKEFGGDRSLIGRTVTLSGDQHVVIGIAPAGFRGLETLVPTDAWIPTRARVAFAKPSSRDFRDYELIARLRDPKGAESARAQLAVLSANLATAFPESERGRSITLVTQREQLDQGVWTALLLLAVVALVLLTACANVAALVLARAETRRREIALRTALGARRSQIFRLLLSEGLLLALAGAVFGMGLTQLVIRIHPLFMPPSLAELRADMHLGGPVLLFTAFITLGSALLFSLAPLTQSFRRDLVPALKAEEAADGGRRRFSLRDLLVVVQIAVAVVLLCGTGLLLRSLAFSSRIHAGFGEDKNLLFLRLTPSLAGYSDESSAQVLDQLSQRIAALPGIKRASFGRRALLTGSGGGASMRVSVPGETLAPELQSVQIKFNAVSPGYFQTVGTRLLQGRDFTLADAKGGPSVAIISEAMARRYWPDRPALGRHFIMNEKDTEVIGVAENATVNYIHERAQPYMYVPFAQLPSGEATLMVETLRKPSSSVAEIRQNIATLDPKLLVLDALSLSDLMHLALWQERINAGVASLLCGIGILLAMAGLYGVIAYFVHRRAHEIGIRMALGAQTADVRNLVLARGIRLAVAGTLVGIIAALIVTRFIAGHLYGVSALDPLSFALAALLAIVVALSACLIPARRACKLDPIIALRSE